MGSIKKSIICITCPQGCVITINGDPQKGTIESIEGNNCKRGITYAESEFFHPVRILTSSVKTSGAASPLLSVRTAKPIPKELIYSGMDEIKKLTVTGKINSGDIIVSDFLETGINLIASGSLE